MSELNMCNNGLWAFKPKIVTIWPFYKKKFANHRKSSQPMVILPFWGYMQCQETFLVVMVERVVVDSLGKQ
jgi:hypothetical protein